MIVIVQVWPLLQLLGGLTCNSDQYNKYQGETSCEGWHSDTVILCPVWSWLPDARTQLACSGSWSHSDVCELPSSGHNTRTSWWRHWLSWWCWSIYWSGVKTNRELVRMVDLFWTNPRLISAWAGPIMRSMATITTFFLGGSPGTSLRTGTGLMRG